MRSVQRIPTKKVPFGVMKGLYQGLDENMLSLAYSPDCQNFTVAEGILSTVKGSTKLNSDALPAGYTFKALYKHIVYPSDSSLIVGASNSGGASKWYNLTSGGLLEEIIADPTGASLTPVLPQDTTTVQVLDGATSEIILVHFTGPYKIIGNHWYSMPATVPRALVGALHRERLWLGGYTPYNTVNYSNAYDPEDFTTAGETGTIDIETGDGDRVFAMTNIFDDVFVFKKNGIWRINGDTPSEYSVDRIFAIHGTVNKRGVHSDGNRCVFAGLDGFYLYDGTNVYPLMTDSIKNAFSKVAYRVAYYITTRVMNNKVYVASSYTDDKKILIYDFDKKTIEVIKPQGLTHITTVETSENGVVYYTDGTNVYHFDSTKIKFDDDNIVAYWITPKTDFGFPNAVKFLTGLYFTGWGTDNAGAAGGQVKVTIYYYEDGTEYSEEETITLQTERNLEYLQPMVAGRIFRFKFENVSGSAINLSGIEAVFEVSED